MARRKSVTEIDPLSGKVTVVSTSYIPKEVIKTQTQLHSRMFTNASYSCSVYAQRIKYAIVHRLNEIRKNVAKELNYNAVDIRNEMLAMANDTRNLTLEFNTSELTFTANYHKKRLKSALEELYNMSFDCVLAKSEDNAVIKNSDPEYNYVFRLIYQYVIDNEAEKVHISLTPTAYKIIFNFVNQYSQYDYSIIRQFECKYSCRFYEMLYSLTEPIEFNIDTLRKRFQVNYKQPADIVKKVVEPAMAEIERYSPKMFKHEIVMTKQSDGVGRKSISKIRFIPCDNPNVEYNNIHKKEIEQSEKRQALLENRISIAQALPTDVLHTLKNTFSFKDEEIHNNASMLNLWVHYTTEGDRSVVFARIANQADVKDFKKYTIGVIKNEVSILEEQERNRRNFASKTPQPQEDDFTLPF